MNAFTAATQASSSFLSGKRGAQAKGTKDKETAVGRPGTAQDLANAVVFLCSNEAEFVTGDVLNVTGGWLL